VSRRRGLVTNRRSTPASGAGARSDGERARLVTNRRSTPASTAGARGEGAARVFDDEPSLHPGKRGGGGRRPRGGPVSGRTVARCRQARRRRQARNPQKRAGEACGPALLAGVVRRLVTRPGVGLRPAPAPLAGAERRFITRPRRRLMTCPRPACRGGATVRYQTRTPPRHFPPPPRSPGRSDGSSPDAHAAPSLPAPAPLVGVERRFVTRRARRPVTSRPRPACRGGATVRHQTRTARTTRVWRLPAP
jgi:hypothetical protein